MSGTTSSCGSPSPVSTAARSTTSASKAADHFRVLTSAQGRVQGRVQPRMRMRERAIGMRNPAQRRLSPAGDGAAPYVGDGVTNVGAEPGAGVESKLTVQRSEAVDVAVERR